MSLTRVPSDMVIGGVGGGGSGVSAVTKDQFSGNGVQTIFSLSSTCNAIQVYIGGVYQNEDTYALVGTTLTFDSAPASGTNNIEVVKYSTDGSLVAPAPTTDNAIARFDGTGGSVLQNSNWVLDDAGSLTATGTGQRFKADFSNATLANRLMFQTSTVNGNTALHALPNGTSTISSFNAESSSTDPANGYAAQMQIDGTQMTLLAAARGTAAATPIPMRFVTAGVERYRLSGSENRFQADCSNATVASRFGFQNSVADTYTAFIVQPNGTGNGSYVHMFGQNDTANASLFQVGVSPAGSRALVNSTRTGTGAFLPVFVATSNLDRIKVDTDGTTTFVSSAFGYGAGAGGTVTQATSKSTSVTLHKPSGQITMHNAALAAGASVEFVLNNNLISVNDVVICTVTGYQNYIAQAQRVASGGVVIRLTNYSAGSLSEAVTLNFAIIKGSAT